MVGHIDELAHEGRFADVRQLLEAIARETDDTGRAELLPHAEAAFDPSDYNIDPMSLIEAM